MRKIQPQKGMQEITSGGTGHTRSFAPWGPPPAAAPGPGQPPAAPPSAPVAPPAAFAPPTVPAWGPPQHGGGATPQQHMTPMPPPPSQQQPGQARTPGMTQSFNRGIIKQQVVGAYGQAKEILAVAEQEAARIVEDAHRLREEQARAGYQEGYKKAYEECLGRLGAIETETRQLFEDLEPKIVQLSVKVAEKIIGSELAERPDAIADIVAQALKTVRHQKEIMIRVHPAHVDVLDNNKRTLLGVLSRARDVTIRGDPSMREGGCMIETELGLLDADLRTQLEILERALSGGLPKKEMAIIEESLVSGHQPSGDGDEQASEDESGDGGQETGDGSEEESS